MRGVGIYEHCLSAEQARQALSYDPKTGEIVWRSPASCKMKVGQVAGSVRSDGYRSIRVNYHKYYAHRLAWLLHYGEWPNGDIDHENHDPSDNRIKNLRSVSNAENHKNLPKYRCNKSGIPGIYLSESGTWRARVYMDRKLHHAGTHVCLGRAIKALSNTKLRLGFHSNHGQPRAA